MSAGHSPPGTATRRGWGSPSSPGATSPSPPWLAGEPSAWRSPHQCCRQRVTVPPPTQHWSPCVSGGGGGGLCSFTPLLSSVPHKFLLSCLLACPGLPFLPHTFPLSSHAHSPFPGGGNTTALGTPVRVTRQGRREHAGRRGPAMRQGTARDGGPGPTASHGPRRPHGTERAGPAARRLPGRGALWDARAARRRAALFCSKSNPGWQGK